MKRNINICKKFFKSKTEKELDALIEKLEMNMSNNYKDAAQQNFKAFEEALAKVKASGLLKPAVLASYEETLENYRKRLQGYTHKDQKPYWT